MIRLNVPYREKDEAKAFGARWNPEGKFWYWNGDELPEGLVRWSLPEEEPSIGAAEDVFGAAAKRRAARPAEAAAPGEQRAAHPGTGKAAPTLAAEPEKGPAGYSSVSEVNDMIRFHYQNTAEFRRILVWGEVTNFRGANNGNYYFAIKDKQALLNCMLWRDTASLILNFELQSGQKVAIAGSLDLYKGDGKTQLVVRQIMNIGEGAASLAFLQLKEKLGAEGLFDPAFKKPIPKHPRAVGIVTSKDGQAIKDICKVAGGRNPYVQLYLFHVKVQGSQSVRTIVEGIRYLDGMGLDTIIVGRGGGSDEDLMAYNDEMVARTVFQARTPIVSAVGHEGNWTLTDETADLRVATPTEAAQVTVPDVMTEIRAIEQLRLNMQVHMRNNLQKRKLLLEAGTVRLESLNPGRILKERMERLLYLEEELTRRIRDAWEQRNHWCEVLTAQLHGLSPTAKLVKGFGYISFEDRPVVSVKNVRAGDRIEIRIHDGRICSQVTETIEDRQENREE